MIKDIFNWGNLSKWRNEIYGATILWLIVFHLFEAYKKIHFNWSIVYAFRCGSIGVDLFLIMSGICLYFSLKKSLAKNRNLDFYKKRFSKVLKVYLFFCIPYLALLYLFKNNSFDLFIHQITFTAPRLSSFWFICCISICYLIYPLLFDMIEKNKSKHVIMLCIAYIIFLVLLEYFNKSLFIKYEICITRFPAFFIGALLGKKVYEKKPINQNFVLIFLALLFSLSPFLYVIRRIPFIKYWAGLFNRLYLSVIALGVIFLLIIIFEIFDIKKIKQLLSFIGKYTLEIYVTHIAFRSFFIYILEIKLTTVSQIVICGFIYIIISVLLGYGLNKLLNLISIKNFKSKKLSQNKQQA